MKRLFLPLLVTSAIVTACSNDDDVIYSADGQTTGVSFTIEPLTVADEPAATRTDVSVSVLGPSITWALADTLGVFPVNGYPTAFPISASVGEKSAVFDGGDWALRPSTSYAAYYPFSIRHLNRSAIPAVYSGQVQRGNGDTRHLGAYGYMAAAYSEVNAEGNVDFKMANLGALLCFELTVPEADTFTSFIGEASSNIFTQTATFDVTASRPSLTPVSRTSSFTLSLDGVSVASPSEKVVLYAWVAPVACKNQDLTFTLVGQKHTYTATAGGDDLVANSYHKYPLTLEAVKESNAPAAAEAVDLGLISNGKKLLWANMNVGAESPTDYGGYFAWGETVPYGGVDESNAMNYSYTGGSYTKAYYGWDTYKYCKGSSSFTKYVPSGQASEYGYNGFYDNKTVLDPEDDAATVNWGADWRMPTRAEQDALRSQCTWTWVTSYNGKSVNGYKVSGNGHEIFLPAAGRISNSSPGNVGSEGYYWSSSLNNPYNARDLYFSSGGYGSLIKSPRYIGKSVRPVRAAQEYSVFVSSLSLNKTTLALNPDATETLTVSVTPSNAESHVTWTSSDESVATVDAFGVVTAIKAGTTVIRVTTIDGTGKYAECNVTVKDLVLTAPANLEAVDLGVVMNGKKVLWANMNVGAESPTDYGGYFAWGETVPYGGVDESNATNYSYTGGSYTKTYYDWNTYKYMTPGMNLWTGVTKYTYPDGQTSGVWYKNGSFIGDRKTVLDPEDDAATANWGADWRMPTHAELRALYNQCTWTWVTTYNGKSVNGYKVSGNGHEIFLPAAGYRDYGSPYRVGSHGDYWSSSLGESSSDGAWSLYFYSDSINPDDYYYRYSGQSVRPVRAAQN